MKTPKNFKLPARQTLGTLHNPVLPHVLNEVRSLVNATYALHGGMGHLTLNEWRDLEQEIKRKLEQEYPRNQ